MVNKGGGEKSFSEEYRGGQKWQSQSFIAQ